MLRRILIALLVTTTLATAEEPHYLYYRDKSGDTLVSIAREHNTDRGAILAMNPGLEASNGSLSPGNLIFVPHPNYKPDVASSWEHLKAKGPRKPPPKQVLDPDTKEWDYLTEYGIEGKATAPAPEPEPEQPKNIMRFDDGRVIEVPSYQKPGQQPKRRSSLSSRRGRAIFGLLKTARSFMGIPYVWGGEQPTGADCSGYVQMVFHRHGVSLPRTADVQFKTGAPVAKGEERPGDLVFFETYAPGASHVGIYLGRNHFIHASSRAKKVTINQLDEEFFKKRYLGAKRHL